MHARRTRPFWLGAVAVSGLCGLALGVLLITGMFDQGAKGDRLQSFELSTTSAFSVEPVPNERTFTLDDLLENVDNFVRTPSGGVDWRLLGGTGQEPYSFTDTDGMSWSGVRPLFTDAVKKLDNTAITVQGFMFPLGQDEKQPLFLIGPFPVTCPFHYHVTPNLIIEVRARTAIPFSYDAVTVQGRLELVARDDEYNVFYRLHDAIAVKNP